MVNLFLTLGLLSFLRITVSTRWPWAKRGLSMQQNPVELWSIIASVVSVLLGLLAIGLSVYFFGHGRDTERAVSNSLTKIETQAEMLQKVTSRQMDRLTKYVTEDRPAEPDMAQTLIALLELARPLTANLQHSLGVADTERLATELVTCYIGLYYYTVQTNYWAQWHLPAIVDFDETNQFHVLVKRVIDQSAVDFAAMARLLESVDRPRLDGSPVAHLLQEATQVWREAVKSCADVYIAREQAERP